MFGTLILGLIAAAVTPFAEPHIKRALESAAMAQMPVSPAELRALALAVCLLVAAVCAWLVAANSAVALALGAVIGVFGPRVLGKMRGE